MRVEAANAQLQCEVVLKAWGMNAEDARCDQRPPGVRGLARHRLAWHCASATVCPSAVRGPHQFRCESSCRSQQRRDRTDRCGRRPGSPCRNAGHARCNRKGRQPRNRRGSGARIQSLRRRRRLHEPRGRVQDGGTRVFGSMGSGDRANERRGTALRHQSAGRGSALLATDSRSASTSRPAR